MDQESSQNASQSVQQRELPHQVHENVWMWSRFSEEKGLYFNGFALRVLDSLILIDPPEADERVLDRLSELGRPTAIVLTNRDHERASDMLRRHFDIPVAVHELDAPLLEHKPDKTFLDGDLLP